MSSVDNFRKVPVKIPYKSGFDKSHRNTLTGTTGTLIPVLCDELLPNSDVFLRMPFVLGMPPLATDTFMNVNYKLEAFFVPTRLLMKGYEKWINGETSITVGGVSSKIRTPVISFVVSSTYPDEHNDWIKPGDLADYLGFKSDIAVGSDDKVNISAFPFLAYHLIYNEWYRNSLVQKDIMSYDISSVYQAKNFTSVIPLERDLEYEIHPASKFEDNVAIGSLRQRNFGADYFTVSTPRTQNGPVMGVNLSIVDGVTNSINNPIRFGSETEKGKGSFNSGVNRNAETTSSKSNGFTIASLRAANSMQQFLERNNIAGNRFVDFLRANYGADLSDGVAQRPVYLGSSSTPVYVNGVLQTANGGDESGNNPFNSVGSNYGKAIAQDKDFVVKFHTSEPGYLMVLGSLVPEVTYSSGVRRYLTRYTLPDSRADMANHLLQNVGQQPIYMSEIEGWLDSSDFGNVFGFVDRYADWMTSNNELHGLFRDGESLESFALQRSYLSVEDGITSSFLMIPKNYLDQVMAVTNENAGYSYWVDFYCDYKVSMPLARYSIPSLQDPAYEHGDTVWLNRGGVRIE